MILDIHGCSLKIHREFLGGCLLEDDRGAGYRRGLPTRERTLMARKAFCVGINDYPVDGNDLNS